MKQVNITSPLRMMVLLLGLFLSVGAFAQIDVKGHVKDAQGEPIIGATVRVVLTLACRMWAIRPRPLRQQVISKSLFRRMQRCWKTSLLSVMVLPEKRT